MAAVGQVTDGQLVERVDTTAKTNNSGSSMDKEAFLQLLVAQMKYQDPLEPTSNTEYVAQYAQFSQVEMLQNMSGTMDSSAAMALVGKTVTVETESATGTTQQITGIVDYVERNSGKNLLYIDGVPYNYDNLVNVWSDDYLDAVEKSLKEAAAAEDGADTASGTQTTETKEAASEAATDKNGAKDTEKAASETGSTANSTDSAKETDRADESESAQSTVTPDVANASAGDRAADENADEENGGVSDEAAEPLDTDLDA